MSISSVQQEILDRLSQLDLSDQIRVRDFVETLAGPPIRGEPGSQLVQVAGSIPQEDLEEMNQAIELGCERVDLDGWQTPS